MFKQQHFLLRFRPDAVVATGGYVSAPILFATGALKKLGLLKTKIMLHEANAELGRMNAAAAKIADKVAVSFSMEQRSLQPKRCSLDTPFVNVWWLISRR